LKTRFPDARVLSYDDVPLALAALRNGNVQAITQDAEILAGLLAASPDKAKYKILPDLLSREDIGIAVKKNEKALLSEVNKVLVELEANGQAQKTFDRWFGKDSQTPETRNFKIVAP
jgi:polar amino acid transport system substrate-binding protein